MTLEGDRVADDPIKDGVLESYNTGSQCNLETEPEKNKGQRSQKTEDSSIDTHVETSTLEDESNGTNSRRDSLVDINEHTDTKTAAFPALSRNQRKRMRKKQRLNSSKITDEVQVSLADFDLTGAKENSLISEKQSDSVGSPSGSIVKKHNGGDPLIAVASVRRNKKMLDASVITDKAHFPPAELNTSTERIYGKEIDSHRSPSRNQVAAHILAGKENAETNHIEGELRLNGRSRKKSFHSSRNMEPTITAEGVVSNSDERHSTKIANNEVEGVINVSIEERNLHQQLHPLVGARFECTNKKLLILDVNGLLADIVSQIDRKYKHDIIVSRKYVFKRPFCDSFLQFCFEKFHVGVWSSRLKTNLDTIVNFLMPDSRCKLLFCWDQSHCTNTGFTTPSNSRKPLFLKELKKLWDKLEPGLQWNKGEYNETNTLLIDDSPYKALSNPANTAIFPHSYDHKNAEDCSLGPGGDLRAYLEKLAEAPNVQEYVACNPFGQKAITELNDFHQKVLRSISRDESCVKVAIASEPLPPLPLPPQLPAINLGTANIGIYSQFQQSDLIAGSSFGDLMPRPFSTNNSHVLVEPGVGLWHEISPPFSSRGVERLLPGAGDDQYDPFLDSIEPSSNSFKKSDHIQKLEAPGSSDIVQSLKEPNLPLDVEENNKKKDLSEIAFATSPNIEEFGVSACDVENGNQGDRNALENTDMAEMEIDQKKSSGTSKKSEESRSMKLFKASLSDFVKEVLNPMWKEGDISREAYKTVVKKTVDKVLGSMKSHHVPKSKEKIDKYIDSSERKITKLVMGYVDKYA